MASKVIIDNYVGKTIGSVIQNPHIAKCVNNGAITLQLPTDNLPEYEDWMYLFVINNNDNQTAYSGTTIVNCVPQHLFSFNIIAEVERKIGTIPNCTTTAEKVAWIKNNIFNMKWNWYGYGESPKGNYAVLSPFNYSNNNYNDYVTTNTSSTSSLLTRNLSTQADIGWIVDSNGFVHFLAYTNPSSATSNTLLVLSNHGLEYQDIIENVTKNKRMLIASYTTNTIYNTYFDDIAGQQIGDVINKYHNDGRVFRTAESGTNSSTIVLSSHDWVVGDAVWVGSTGITKVTAINGNQISVSPSLSGLSQGCVLYVRKFVGQQYVDGTNSTQVTIKNHGLVNNEIIENVTRNTIRMISGCDNNTLITSSITGQTSGDTINKYKAITNSNRITETGTNSTTIIITNHGITSSGVIQGTATDWNIYKVTVVNANTLQLSSPVANLSSGTELFLYQFAGTQTAESGVIDSAIYTDYVELELNVNTDTYKDTAYPTISSTFNATKYTAMDYISIPYSIANTNGGVLSASYTIDGVTNTVNSLSVGANTWNVGQLSKGNHTLTIEVTNSASLKSNRLVFYIAIDSYVVPNYVKSGLVLDLNANDVSKTNQPYWFDRTSNGFMGTLKNFGYTTGSGWNNYGLSFDGSNDYVSIPNDSKLNTNAWTWEFYLSPKQVADTRYIIYSGDTNVTNNGFSFAVNSNGTWGYTFGRGQNGLAWGNIGTVSYNKPNHIIYTFQQGIGYKIYINNILITSGNNTDYSINTTVATLLGVSKNLSGVLQSFFNGDIYYTRMYNRALTPSEVSQNYQNATNTPSDLSVSPVNGQVNLTWVDKVLDSTQYRIKRNGTLLTTLSKNSTVLKNELKVQRWVTSPTNPMIDGGSLGAGHLYQTSPISKADLYTWSKFNSTHDITKPYATHGLLLYYDFKEGQGTQNKAFDKSGLSNHGTLYGFDYTTTGWIDNGLKTSTSRVNFPNVLSGKKEYTIEYSGYIDKSIDTSWSPIVCLVESGDRLEFDNAKNVVWRTYNSNTLSGGIPTGAVICSYPLGKRVSLIVSVSEKKGINIYLDGVLVKTLQHNGTYISTSTYGALNSWNTIGVGMGIPKTMYTFRLYDRALDVAEVQKNYLSTLPYTSDGLILHLDAQNASGTTWTDLSGNGNNGTLKNFGATTTSGWNNNKLVFDGVDDYVEIANSTSLNPSAITVEMLFEPIEYNGSHTLLSKNSSGQFAILQSYNRLDFAINNKNVFQANVNWIYGLRYHVAITYTPSSAKYYINGVFNGEVTTIADTIPTSTNNILIGKQENGTGGRTLGTVDLVRIYNRVLTREEVLKNYQDALPRMNANTNGLVLSLDARNGYGNQTTWYDSSGNGNNATLNNFNFDSSDGWQSDKLAFDGSNDYVNIPHSTSLNLTTLTGELIIETGSTAPNGYIGYFYKGNFASGVDSPFQVMGNNGEIYAIFNSDGTSNNNVTLSYGTFTAGQKLHLSFSAGNGVAKIYLDGNLITSFTYNGVLKTNTLSVGLLDGTFCANCKVYKASLYNRVLSDAEVTQLYLDSMGLNKSCILSYDFAGGSGTTITDKISGVVGTLNNFANTTFDGWTGKSLITDGIDDYISVPNKATSFQTTLFTAETYMSFKTLADSGKWYSFFTQFAYNSNIGWAVAYYLGQLHVVIGNNDTRVYSKIINANESHHVIFRYNNGSLDLFLDGIKVITSSATITFADVPLIFGGRNANTGTGVSDLLNAEIFLERFYNRALTDTEITANYNNAIGMSSSYITDGLKLYLDAKDYPANSTSTTWLDKSGNSNSATLTNFTLTGTSGWASDGLVFDGVNDYINVASNQIYKDFSIEAVLSFPTSQGGLRYIFSSNNLKWYLDSTNEMYVQCGSGVYDYRSSVLKPQVKYHLLLSVKSSEIGVYINGIKEGSTSRNSDGQFAFPIGIGGSSSGNSVINAKFYSVNVYNKGLSDTEVWERYKECMLDKPYVTKGLVLDLNAESITSGTTWNDKSGYGNNATLSGFTYNAYNGWKKGALYFDGKSDYVKTVDNSAFSIGNNLSFETIFTPAYISGLEQTIIANGENQLKLVLWGDRLFFDYFNSNSTWRTIAFNFYPVVNTTYHVVATLSTTTALLYVNGSLVDTQPFNNDVTPSNALYIGSHEGEPFNGSINLVRFYSKVLSLSEVQQNYNDTNGTQYVKDNLQLYLNAKGYADGSTITTWTDLSGNNRSATLYNFNFSATSGWDKGKLVFDGGNDTVSIPAISSINSNARTIEFVLNPKSWTSGTYLVNINSMAFSLYRVTSATSKLGLNVIYYTSTSALHSMYVENISINTNTKNHIIVRMNSDGSVTISVNNTIYTMSKQSDFSSWCIMNTPHSINMGVELYSYRIYNRGLSDSEILHNYNVAMGLPQYSYEGSDYPESVVTLNDIDLPNVKNIKSINWTPSASASDTALAVLSADSGTTWKAWSGTVWQNVDINNETEILAKGMGKDVVNSIPRGKQPIVYVSDDFNRTDNVATLGNTNTGQSWITLNGSGWGVNSQKAKVTTLGTDTNTYVITNVGYADFVAEVDVTWNSYAGLVFRCDGTYNKFLRYRISPTGVVVYTNNNTLLGSYAFTPVIGNTYKLRVVCNGNSVLCYLDGILRITCADTSYSSYTYCGIQTYNDTISVFDNFNVTSLDGYIDIDTFRGTSTKLKFGYYLRTKILPTMYNNDQLTVTYTNTSDTDVTVGQTYNAGTGNTTSFIDVTPVSGSINTYEAVPYDATNGEGTSVSSSILTPPIASTLSGTVNVNNRTINYTWNTINGVSGYKLYIAHSNGTSTVNDLTSGSYAYNILNEGIVSAYVVNYIYDLTYGYVESAKSNTLSITTYPTATPSNLTYNFNPTSSVMHITWTDNCKVEDGFKLNYSIDGATYSVIDIPSTTSSGIGNTYSADIPITTAIEESLAFYIRPYNSVGDGINATALKTLLTKPSYFQVGYILGYVKYGWIDNTKSEQKYRIFYSIDDGAEQTLDVTSTTVTAEGLIYNAQIPMNTSSTITSYICAVDNSGNLGIPSATLNTSFGTYVKKPAPTDFRVSWKAVGLAEYKWTCNDDEVIGYKLIYQINEDNPVTVDFACPLNSSSHTFSYELQLNNDKDTVIAWVQPYTLIDSGLQSDTQSLTYIVVNTSAPENFWKLRTDTGYLFIWDAKNYVDNYEIHYTIDGEEYITNTPYNNFELEVAKDCSSEFTIYLFANFATLEISDVTPTLRFTPTVTSGGLKTTIYTVDTVLQTIVTKISQLKAKYIFANSMLTTNKDCKFIMPKLVTKWLTYDTKYSGYDAQLTISKDTKSYGRDILVIRNSARTLYVINTRSATNDITVKNKLQTATMFNNVIAKFRDSFVIKNNNATSRFVNSIVIANRDVVQFKKEIIGIFFERVTNSNGYVQYSIWTYTQLIFGVYTEVHKIRLCCLGDSITAGHPNYWAENEINHLPNSGTGRITSQYEYWLQRRLQGDYEVINNGYGSDTTERMLNRFDRDILSLAPQYCIIQGGTNDINWAMVENKGNQQYLDNKMATARLNIIAIVNKCFANNIIPIVGTLIPRTSAQGIYRQAMWDFNKWIIEYCNSRDGLYYADFYNAGKENMPPTPLDEPAVAGNLNPMYDGDSVFDTYGNLVRRGYGVHPNDLGYKIMAEAIPLNIFKAMQTGVKLFIDEKCTVEENNSGTDIYESVYNITFNNLDRGRVKTISKYIKNVGNSPILYSMYVTEESGIDMQFSLDGVNFYNSINGKLDNETINKIYMKVTVPRTGVIPTVATVLSTRSIKIL